MTYDWSTTGHKLPQEALRKSDSLRTVCPTKARLSRIAWERAEAKGFERFDVVAARVVRKVLDANGR